MDINRTIQVTNRGFSPILSIAQGTDMVRFNFRLTDFDIPSGSAAVAYNIQPTGNIVPKTCSISGNTVSIDPPAYYFLRGKNYMQIQITNSGKRIVSFLIEVWCSPNIATPEVVEMGDSTVTQQLLSEVGLLSARINNLAKLEPGSTTGDAELRDIRIGYDGTEYENAGEAVRGQVSSLSEDLDSYKNDISEKVPTTNLWTDGDVSVSAYTTDVYEKINFFEIGKTYVLEASTSISDSDKYKINITGKTEKDGMTTFSTSWTREKVEFTIPNNTPYVSIGLYHASTETVIYTLNIYEKPESGYKIHLSALPDVLLSRIDCVGKKVVWFGTSIPHGSSVGNYPQILSNRLGFTLYNEAVGESSAKAGNADYMNNNPESNNKYDLTYKTCIRRLGNTEEEKQYFIDNFETLKNRSGTIGYPSSLDENEKEKILGYGFERKLDRYLTAYKDSYKGSSLEFVGDVDLYVFDHGYNDRPDLESWDIIPESGTTMERFYFAGAMNFFIRRIFEANPKSKIIIICHYENQLKPKIVEMQEKIANLWGLDRCEVYKKIGWSQQKIIVGGEEKTMLKVWCPDGIHPHSDTTGKALERYADILQPFISDALVIN